MTNEPNPKNPNDPKNPERQQPDKMPNQGGQQAPGRTGQEQANR